jgi:glycosyltransferase involved in cell wall biosynthesis
MPEGKIAFVMDALPGLGGSERVLMAALERFPSAAVYALVYNAPAFAGTPLAGREVCVSWAQHLPFARRHYRSYLPLLPFAVGHLDLRGYDTIISVHYAVAHGVHLNDGQRHLSYVCTPLRYAWRENGTLIPGSRAAHLLAGLVFHFTRRWDRQVSQRVESYAAVSGWAAGNVRRAFDRQARVIYPPVEVGRFHPAVDRADYFLVVSRLVKHKRVDVVVNAFSRLGLPLLVVGEGPERPALQRRAAPNVRFLGYRPDTEVAELMNRARAFVHAGEEDFGIALVEAQAAGAPVIAYGGGAARESVSASLHGLLFPEQTVESLIDAVRRLQSDGCHVDHGELAAHAAHFRPQRFHQDFQAWVRVDDDA